MNNIKKSVRIYEENENHSNLNEIKIKNKNNIKKQMNTREEEEYHIHLRSYVRQQSIAEIHQRQKTKKPYIRSHKKNKKLNKKLYHQLFDTISSYIFSKKDIKAWFRSILVCGDHNGMDLTEESDSKVSTCKTFLSGINLFSSLNDKELYQLAKITELRIFRKNEIIIKNENDLQDTDHTNDPDNINNIGFFMILSGKAHRMYSYENSNSNLPAEILEYQDSFGYQNQHHNHMNMNVSIKKNNKKNIKKPLNDSNINEIKIKLITSIIAGSDILECLWLPSYIIKMMNITPRMEYEFVIILKNYTLGSSNLSNTNHLINNNNNNINHTHNTSEPDQQEEILSNLIQAGIHVTVMANTRNTVNYIILLLSAPLWLLAREDKLMKMERMVEYHSGAGEDDETTILGEEYGANAEMMSPADRISAFSSILTRPTNDKPRGVGIRGIENNQDPIIYDIFPLHDPNITDFIVSSMYKEALNPTIRHLFLLRIKDYFGLRIAFYTAFIQLYNSSLITPLVIGAFLWFIIRWIDYKIYILCLSIYGLSIAFIYAPSFMKRWKRYQTSLLVEWNLLNARETEYPNPTFSNYVIETINIGFNDPNIKLYNMDLHSITNYSNECDYVDIKIYDSRRRWPKYIVFSIFVLFCIILLFLFIGIYVQWYIIAIMTPMCIDPRCNYTLDYCINQCNYLLLNKNIYKYQFLNKINNNCIEYCNINNFDTSYYICNVPLIGCFHTEKGIIGTGRWFYVLIQGIVLGLTLDIAFLNIFEKLALFFNEWENYPTIRQSEKKYIEKIFLFNWIGYFFWFFLLAFLYVPYGNKVQDTIRTYIDNNQFLSLNYKWKFSRYWIDGLVAMDSAFVTPLIVTQSLNLLINTYVPFLLRRALLKARNSYLIGKDQLSLSAIKFTNKATTLVTYHKYKIKKKIKKIKKINQFNQIKNMKQTISDNIILLRSTSQPHIPLEKIIDKVNHSSSLQYHKEIDDDDEEEDDNENDNDNDNANSNDHSNEQEELEEQKEVEEKEKDNNERENDKGNKQKQKQYKDEVKNELKVEENNNENIKESINNQNKNKYHSHQDQNQEKNSNVNVNNNNKSLQNIIPTHLIQNESFILDIDTTNDDNDPIDTTNHTNSNKFNYHLSFLKKNQRSTSESMLLKKNLPSLTLYLPNIILNNNVNSNINDLQHSTELLNNNMIHNNKKKLVKYKSKTTSPTNSNTIEFNHNTNNHINNYPINNATTTTNELYDINDEKINNKNNLDSMIHKKDNYYNETDSNHDLDEDNDMIDNNNNLNNNIFTTMDIIRGYSQAEREEHAHRLIEKLPIRTIDLEATIDGLLNYSNQSNLTINNINTNSTLLSNHSNNINRLNININDLDLYQLTSYEWLKNMMYCINKKNKYKDVWSDFTFHNTNGILPVRFISNWRCRNYIYTADRILEESMMPVYSTFGDLLHMAIQFSYIIMFSIIWPFCALCAYCNNVIALRFDAIKMVIDCKRAIPRRTIGIGPWSGAFLFEIIIAGMIVPGLFVHVTGQFDAFNPNCYDFINENIYGPVLECYHSTTRLIGFCILENIGIAVCFFVYLNKSDISGETSIRIQEQGRKLKYNIRKSIRTIGETILVRVNNNNNPLKEWQEGTVAWVKNGKIKVNFTYSIDKNINNHHPPFNTPSRKDLYKEEIWLDENQQYILGTPKPIQIFEKNMKILVASNTNPCRWYEGTISQLDTRDHLGQNLIYSPNEVHFRIIQARNLKSLLRNVLDPYCVITCGTFKHITSVKRHTKNPVWDEGMIFSTPNYHSIESNHLISSSFIIKINIYNHDTLSLGECIGETEIDLLQHIDGKLIEQWIPISHKKHGLKIEGFKNKKYNNNTNLSLSTTPIDIELNTPTSNRSFLSSSPTISCINNISPTLSNINLNLNETNINNNNNNNKTNNNKLKNKNKNKNNIRNITRFSKAALLIECQWIDTRFPTRVLLNVKGNVELSKKYVSRKFCEKKVCIGIQENDIRTGRLFSSEN